MRGLRRPTCRLSTENATESTSLVCPTNRRVVLPVFRSHRRRVPSQDPDSANCPSLLITTSCVGCEASFSGTAGDGDLCRLWRMLYASVLQAPARSIAARVVRRIAVMSI